MMSAVSAVPMGMLSAATCDELSSIHLQLLPELRLESDLWQHGPALT